MDPNLSAKIDSKINTILQLPVISGYHLVLGGGKIGKKFTEHARKQSLPFVLVIDSDCDAPASKNAEVLREWKQLKDIISSFTASTGRAIDPEPSHKTEGSEPVIYFYCMDAKEVPSLLLYGMPEYIVPAIPSHAAVDMVVDFLSFDQDQGSVCELSVNEGGNTAAFFESMASAFPENIVAGVFPEHGAIFFSYARPGEICPDNCMGPEGYCYTFKRVKPRTITSYVREYSMQHTGWVFESCQMGPGIGGIRGADLKANLISVMERVRELRERSPGPGIEERSFFIATTCNCHGILNVLHLVDE
ncbi:MAG: hypothetical protein JW705_00300 [Methanosarcinaceae archaeon]|nr:hypothetical protein [Methanosarcinaceae archaeon]